MRPRIVHPQCDRTMTRGLQALSPKGQPQEGGSSPSGVWPGVVAGQPVAYRIRTLNTG